MSGGWDDEKKDGNPGKIFQKLCIIFNFDDIRKQVNYCEASV